MVEAPYVTIQDEIELIYELLTDPERNFHLNDILKIDDSYIKGGSEMERNKQIGRRKIDHFGQLPYLSMERIGVTSIEFGMPISRDTLVDRYQARIKFDVYVGRDEEVVYNGIHYYDSQRSAFLINELILHTFVHSPRYSGNGMCIADMQFDGFATVQRFGNKNDVDLSRLFLTLVIEKGRPYYKLITNR